MREGKEDRSRGDSQKGKRGGRKEGRLVKMNFKGC
jgi:hypothetical protein